MPQWTVQTGDQKDTLRKWQAGLARAFVRLDAEPAGSANAFAGRIDQVGAGGLQVSRVRASAHRVVRRREHLAPASCEMAFANLQLSGRGLTTMGGRTWEAAPMDLTVVPTGEAYAIEHAAPFELVTFAVPLTAVPDDLSPGCVTLSASAVGREVAGVLAALAGIAAASPGDGSGVGPALEAQILGAIGLAAAAGRGGESRARDGNPDVLRAAVRAYIARRHSDPSMSAAPVAAEFGLDERRLHALFEKTEHSVGARIEAARLGTAERLLAQTDLPVSVVARRSGFADPGYFARVFRRAHGASPRDWRAARSS